MMDKTPFWAVLFVQPLSYNTEHCLLNVIYDQTDRRRVEKERERLAMAIEHCADGVAITDNMWNVQYINPAFESITGYSGAEFDGKNLNLLKSDRQAGSPYEEFEPMLREEEVWGGRMVSRKKDGTHYEAEISVSSIRDETGEVMNFVVVHRDITYEVQLENRLRQAQKMEAVGALSGGIAHDFNNILSAVLGYSELALLKAGDNVGLVRSIRQIHKAGQRATALVRQILTFSRKTIHEKTICRMSGIVKEALEMLRSTIPTTIEIKHKIDCKGVILADATQIHQIVVNLCTNAYHAMRETGGTLEIELLEKEIRQKKLRDLTPEPGKYVLLKVKDTGCGMDDEIMEKMFEPYFSTKVAEEGTGLGLSVVHGIVKGHGGDIIVHSEPGKGSVFQIYLPVVEEPEKVNTDKKDEIQMVEGSETIMFVDDEESLVELARESFGESGYTIKTFENGRQALEAFRQNPHEYDLIVTDMNMPLLNGMDLARKVMELRPSIPVVLCTGYSKLINKEKAIKMGIRGYLEKPLTMGSLMHEVRTVLDN
jgi:PAS domain S-box-containing protein